MTEKLKDYVKSYKLLVMLSVVLAFLSVDYILLTAIAEDTDRAATDLKRKVRGLKINETQSHLEEIEALMNAYNLPVMGSAEARDLVLEFLEDFRRLYDAKITKPISEDKSSITAGIKFDFAPENPADLTRLLSYLKNSRSPIYHVTSINFRYNKSRETRSVNIEADVIQPFAGGQYDF